MKFKRLYFIGLFLFFESIAVPWVGAENYVSRPLRQDNIHDPTNDAIKFLQEPNQSMGLFPQDRRGQINWVETLNQGLINPRKSLAGDEMGGVPLLEMDMDILMTSTAEMPHVRFPHLAHTRWLVCANCHPKIFIPQKDANPINMTEILGGEYCGRCHGKVAFTLWVCERCHSVPHANSPAAWWR